MIPKLPFCSELVQLKSSLSFCLWKLVQEPSEAETCLQSVEINCPIKKREQHFPQGINSVSMATDHGGKTASFQCWHDTKPEASADLENS
jgi:hypothetical protein